MSKHETERSDSNAPATEGAVGDAELLPEELVWAAGGHASDVVLTAMADGQSAIVPPSVRAHVERCPLCMGHLGNATLLSLHVGAELDLRAEHERRTERRPLPGRAIAVGLVLAALGLVPSILDGEATMRTFRENVLLFVRGFGPLVRRLADPNHPAGVILTYSAATMLVLMGLALVRILPKLAHKEGSR